MTEPSPKRVLIVAVNWLGDLLFMTPAIRAIRRFYPKAHIACLVAPRGVELLTGNPHLDTVIPFEEGRGIRGMLGWWSLVQRLKAQRFDTAFFFHRSASRVFLAWLAGIRSRIGYWTWKRGWLLTQAVDVPPQDSVHKALYYLKVVEKAGLPTDGLTYDIGLLPEDELTAKRLFEEKKITSQDRLVALHVGANWRLKRYSACSFAQLADALAQRHQVKVLLIGSQADLPIISEIISQVRTKPIVVAGELNFRALGALLKKVRLLISNDSGPLHLGCAVGTPVVGLFGPTDPDLTGPMEGARAITLFGSIGCPVPCLALRCPVNLCMDEIKVEQILAAAGQLLPRHIHG